MKKMAADFLESNLFNPTAPSEQSMEEAKLRKVKMEESNKGRLDQNKREAQMLPRKVFLNSLHDQRQSTNNNKNEACLSTSSNETSIRNIGNFNEAIPIEVLLRSTKRRPIEKRLIEIDMNIDTYCKIVLREKTRIRTENLGNKSAPLSIIEEDEGVDGNNEIKEEIDIDTTKNKCISTKSEELSKRTTSYIDSHTRNLSYARKNLLYKVHYLVKVNSRGGANKDDKILLVGENNSELDLHQHITSKAENGKKKNELRYFLATRIQNLWHKWIRERNKDATLVDVSAPAKKKRRLRKKNVSRIGHRIRKRFSHGCRYVGHGIANMTSVIPEASFAGTLHDFHSYSDYEFNPYYDPNAPVWDFNKGLYSRKS